MDAATQASSILSKLQGYDYADIDLQFSDYLNPLISPKTKKPSNRKQQTSSSSSIRSLAKTHFPFVAQSLSLLPKRLSESPKHPNTQLFLPQLLHSYRLCLDCLDAVSSILSGKPYSVQIHRARFISCLQRWESYDEAIDEGFRVLKALGSVQLQDFDGKLTMGESLPRILDAKNSGNAVDADFVHLIVDVVVAIAHCVSTSKTKDAGKYTGLLILLHEVRPWLSIFMYQDACACTKLRLRLLNYMKKATLFLVKEAKHFEGDLIPEFSKATFDEYIQMLNSQNPQEDRMGEELEEFVEFVSNYTYRCRSAPTTVLVALAMHLQQSTSIFCQDLAYFSLIQRLYAIGLYLSEFNTKPNDFFSPDSRDSICTLRPRCWDKLEDLCALLESDKKYNYFDLGDYDKPMWCEDGILVVQLSPSSKCDHKGSMSHVSADKADHLPYYLNALKFLCCPLADFVYSQRKRIISDEVESTFGSALKLIHKAFLEYCNLFLHCQKEKEAHGRIDTNVIKISVAAYTLSLKLNLNIKGSKRLLNYLLSDNCIRSLQPQILKYIISMLTNIFVDFYKVDRRKEASKALKLCFRASWSCCLLLCEMLVGKLPGFDEELSEAMVTASLDEACKLSSHLVDVFRDVNDHKLEKIMVLGLEKWSLAKNLFRKLPSPIVLVKCWVKMQCKSFGNTDVSDSILGSHLMCSPCMMKHNSNETVRIILEQELLAYQGMSNLYPMFSQRTQMKITDILLKSVHDLNFIQRANILVRKGMISRAYGIGGLENCILFLSEALDTINNSCGISAVSHEEAASKSHQLAVIYCLRAMCTQEANPNSKDMFDDIHEAVSLWLKTDIPDCLSIGLCDLGCEYVLLLLYHIADLLSIKGDMTIHLDVLNVIIKVFKQRGVSLEKCLSLMWESRRVNHALCVVPVNEVFIMALSDHYGRDAESIDFWISSMKNCQPLLVGLQQNFSQLSTLFPLAFRQHKHSLCTEIPVDVVREVASDLVLQVSLTRHSAFLAGYLYYDLSERLYTSGQMIEALFFAKEAHRLRGKMLQEHFSCSFEQCEEKQDENGKNIHKSSPCVNQFSVSHRVAMRAWPIGAISQDSEGLILTPWNVLRCYLESIMQVGIVHEKLGNGAESEVYFRQGMRISRLQGLPRFIIAFSSCLGKVHLGKGLLDAARMELESAEKDLAVERSFVTCSRCLLMLETTVMEQLGNLYRKGNNSAKRDPYEFCIRRLISLEKGDVAVWIEEANSASTMLQDEVAISTASGFGREANTNTIAALLGVGSPSKPDRTKTKTETKRLRKTKKASEVLGTGSSCVDHNLRVTRSRKQSSKCNGVSSTERVENVRENFSKFKPENEDMSISNKVYCQKCFSDDLKKYGSFARVIQMKWEFIRRRKILRVLIGLGKCEIASAGTPRLLKIYSKCVSLLVGGNDCKCLSSSLEPELIGKEIPGDALAVERAEVCYNLCWLSLKDLYSKDIRSVPCGPCYKMSQVVSLLKLSFVLTREVPSLFQKVSRLLALTYVVSSVKEKLSFPLSSSKVLSENYWAAYFHQASVGAHHNVRLLSVYTLKHKTQLPYKYKDSEAAAPNRMATDISVLLRAAPDSIKEIEASVENFFNILPSTTVVCISLLDDSYVSLLEELIHYPSTVYGWMLLSHLHANNQPAVTLIPLSSILQDEKPSSSCSVLGEKKLSKEWRCPWGWSAVVDDVAPLFGQILRGNYVSSSNFPDKDTEKNFEIWRSWRASLDKCLDKLLRDMEESWFGTWRYLLLGRWLECEPLSSVARELVQEIKVQYKSHVKEDLLKLVLGGIKTANLENEGIPSLFLHKGCYVGCIEDSVRESCNSQSEACNSANYVSDGVIQSMLAAVNKLETEYCTCREPVILVLDSNVQMLPLENMPILREQEVYRMPSVVSIFVTLQRRSMLEKDVGRASRYPLIDPLDAFYLLNPSGDLSRTQAEFEEWFRLQNMQGKAGVVPSTEEVTGALEDHDLFYYFGHGCGAQYIPKDKIEKLENCAATMLMGCSSGSLNLNGEYMPVGTSLSYVLAGSPLVIANLWDVTDLEIDRFAKAVLKSFVDERSMSSSGCIQCSMLAEEMKSLSVNEKKGNTKKGRGRKKKPEPDDAMPDISGGYCFRHKLRAGYFVSQARKACKFPFLIGAAPVCYGVPTGIRKKEEV